ncbi:MAG: hypothetical protein KDI31_16680, partial [Pseudomonadales bacterium]|nr:hypothetical protein [Pseudomonadales bacterium]
FLGERLRIWQTVAVLLAGAGVLNEVVSLGSLPWVGLTLAGTFGLYGLVRKKLAVDSIIGLGVETSLLLPLALGYLVLQAFTGEGTLFRAMPAEIGLLGLGGLITVIPLACFAAAAMRMPLVVLGFFQYLAPTLTLLLAVFVYHEPFRPSQAVTFACIWLALLLFSGEGLYRQFRLRRRTQAIAGSVCLKGEESDEVDAKQMRGKAMIEREMR